MAYSRTRPDGTRIDDVEQSLTYLENRVPVLRAAHKALPLSIEDRSTIAQFAALQYVRTPRWAQALDAELDEAAARIWSQGLPGLDDLMMELLAPKIELEIEKHREKTAILMRMMRAYHYVSAIFFAMHWSLVRFRRPILVTSDHPIVVWPENVNSRPASYAVDQVDLLRTLEVRYPLTAQTCLIMSWAPGKERATVVVGNKQQARNINAFTKGHAELQWFHKPGVAPPFAGDRDSLLPLSPELHPGYGPGQAARNPRRSKLRELIAKMAQAPLQRHMTFDAILPVGFDDPDA